jgi:putative membrane protein
VATTDSPPDHQAKMASMAAERTWLAWWRTALAAAAGALGVGRLAPEVLQVAPWPYIVLGCGYALLAVALLAVGARRQQQLARGGDEHVPLRLRTVVALSGGCVLIALMTIVLVVAQT